LAQTLRSLHAEAGTLRSRRRVLPASKYIVLVLAWNFAAEIIQQNQEYTQMGGQFILPVAERPSL
jgi:C-methyltransferase C-terminal domain